ncbi:MAG: sulfatase-like hydrolase/transferase [Pirellulales bacterium]|nr:sulfatase-like hydrolase/transferase [Pirellulales bacterium]
MRFPRIVYPLLLAAYPPLFLYAHNPGHVLHRSFFTALGTIGVSTLIAWSVLAVLMRSWEKSALTVGAGIVLTFTFGFVRETLSPWISSYLLLGVWISLFFLAAYYCTCLKSSLAVWTRACNAIAGILIAFPLISILIQQSTAGQIQLPSPRADQRESRSTNSLDLFATAPIETEPRDPTTLPDIYFIILDAYGREDVLKDLYDFDNHPFVEALCAKGFYVADRSTSNYSQTGLSIGSCLNLQYLDGLLQAVSEYEKSKAYFIPLVEKSALINTLREHGYSIVSFVTDVPEMGFYSSDVKLNTDVSVNHFHNALQNATPWPDLVRLTRSRRAVDVHRDMLQFKLDALGGVARLPHEPKFVFAYFSVPHPPFVFDRTGASLDIPGEFNHDDGDMLVGHRMSKVEYRKAYCEQLLYVNTCMLQAVDQLLAESKRPPIIFLVGDHGPRSELSWNSAARTNVTECMSNLFACYLPNHLGEDDLYPEISLVNAFRLVLNHYFGANLELLDDANYFSTSETPYRFLNVTERVQGREP